MKNIVKVQDIQHLPETRPIIALDNNKKLYQEKAPKILEIKINQSSVGSNVNIRYMNGMTWGDLINSGFEEEFNRDANLSIGEDNKIYGDDWWPLYKYPDTYPDQQKSTDVIDYNGYYYWYD